MDGIFYRFVYKIVLVGDARVGKTSLRNRFMGAGFRGSYSATLGADFSVKMTNQGKIVIYDLAGDKSSKLVRQSYYVGTQGILMVFSISDRESFEGLSYWVEEIRDNTDQGVPIFLLGNKEDLRGTLDNAITEEEGYQLARQLADDLGTSFSFLSTSALSGYNVDVAFTKLVTEIQNKAAPQ